jgi:type I restriction enzyme M protein
LDNRELIKDTARKGVMAASEVQAITDKLAAHKVLEDELRQLKAEIKETEKHRDDLLDAARDSITPEVAKTLILERFKTELDRQYQSYVRALLLERIAAIENLHRKYKVTAKDIIARREQEASKLAGFMSELGYE